MSLAQRIDGASVVNGPATGADYWNLPDGVRCELMGGKLYDMAPPNREHQRIVGGLYFTLRSHVEAHGGPCEVDMAPFAVNLKGDDSVLVEPDVLVVCDSAKLSERGCESAPDLVVEVASPSNWRVDYFKKMPLYEEAGVREYWIVDPRTRSTAVYRFASEERPLATYPFDAPVPVGIWDGACSVVMADLLK